MLRRLQYNYSSTQNNGKLVSQTDALSGEQLVYTYDALNRLASAQTTSGPTTWGQSYNYDGFGNLTDQNVIAGSAPSMHVAYNPANNRQTGDTADANGNLLPSGGGYVYDVLNRLTSASGASYGYDAQNHRITRTDSSGNQYYTFWGADGKKLCETNIYGTVQQSWAYFGEKLFYNSNTGYVVADRLGSIGKFYPYGQERPSATSNDTEKFTGYFRDSATGLDYAVNRYHQPGMGRFMTADPSASSAQGNDPGSYNRYAYTRGDPVNRVDKNGTCDGSVDAFLSCGGGDDVSVDALDCGGCGYLDQVPGIVALWTACAANNPTMISTFAAGGAYPTAAECSAPESTAPPPRVDCLSGLPASEVGFVLNNYTASVALGTQAGIPNDWVLAWSALESYWGTRGIVTTNGNYVGWRDKVTSRAVTAPQMDLAASADSRPHSRPRYFRRRIISNTVARLITFPLPRFWLINTQRGTQ